GFLYRKKRDDRQKKKITDSTLKKVLKYKSSNPFATLSEIKEEFKLNCSLVLISNRLLKRKKALNPEGQKLTVSYHILKRSAKGESRRKLYQFNIHDNLTDNVFFCFAQEGNIKNLCLFIYITIGKLKEKGYLKKNAQIVTNLNYLKKVDKQKCEYTNYIFSNYGIPLVIEKNINNTRNKIKKLENTTSKHDLLISAYENTLLSNKKLMFVHPIVIDDMLTDLEAYTNFTESGVSYISKNSPMLLNVTLKQIEKYGDKAKINFDFERALDLYDRIYLTSVEYQCEDGQIVKITSLYKQALIYYYLNEYDKSKKYLEDILQYKGRLDIRKFMGDVYSYMGLIDFYLMKNESADANFVKAINVYLSCSKKKFIYEYYQVSIRRFINNKDYRSAITFSNKYLHTAKAHNKMSQVCIAYDLKGVIYYFQGKYKLAEKNYFRELYLTKLNGYKIQEAKAINKLLTLYTFKIVKPEKIIIDLIERLRKVSKIIKKNIYLNHAYYKLANYYFHKQEYRKSEELYLRVYLAYKNHNIQYHKIETLIYMAYCYLYQGKNTKALRYFKEVTSIKDLSNYSLLADIYNNIGKIYYQENQLKYSMKFFYKSIKCAKKISKDELLATSYQCLGVLYEKLEEILKSKNYFHRSLKIYRKLDSEKNKPLYIDKITTIVESIKTL
ncbi:MAG: tetratricopeptide repeat protein, partial [Candidatus Delongbacteria bacterium]|nr:tetratricopeptide repeat protein [Candidatus Delongbacteria bacterium]